jgi:hypothetical protein
MRTPSAACVECRDLIGGYVLDALEPDEAGAVRRHLADCPQCAAEHAKLTSIPALLDMVGAADATFEHPPVTLEEAVLDRFAREHPVHEGRSPLRERLGAFLRPLRNPLPAAGLAAVAAVAATIAIVLPGGGGGDTNGWQANEAYHATLGGSPVAPTARAVARLQGGQSGTRVWLRVSGLRSSPDDLYELWCVRDDGTKISAGTFRVNAHGQATVNLTTAAVVGDYHRLSVERRLQAPAQQAGQRVMTGEIRFGTS